MRIFRIIGIVLCTFFLFILLILAVLPSFVSTTRGQALLADIINSSINGKVSWENLHVSWFGPQQIDRFALCDAEGEMIFSFCSQKSSASLFSLLWGNSIGKTEIIEPKLFVKQAGDGQLNIDRLWKNQKKDKRQTQGKTWRKKKGELIVKSGLFVFRSSLIDTIEVSDIEVDMRSDLRLIEVHANILQGANQGRLVVSANISQEALTATINVSHLPTALLDQMAKSTLASFALGPVLNLDLTIEEKNQTLFITGKVDSQNLKGTLLGHTHTAESGENNFYFDPKSQLTYTFTPGFFDHLFCSSQWKLANRAQIQFSMHELDLKSIAPKGKPRPKGEGKEKRWARNLCLPFAADLHLERAELTHSSLGNVSLSDLNAHFTIQDGLIIDYKGALSSKEGPATVSGQLVCHGDKQWYFSSNYQDLPMTLIELFYPKSESMAQLVGPRFSLQAEGQWQPHHKLDAEYQFLSEHLQLKGTLSGQEELFDLVGSGSLDLPKALHASFGNSAHIDLLSEIWIGKKELSVPLMRLKMDNEMVNAEVRGVLGKAGRAFCYEDVDLIITGLFPQKNRGFFDSGHFLAHMDGEKNEITATIDLKHSQMAAFHTTGEVTILNPISNNALSLETASARFCGQLKQFSTSFFTTHLPRIPFATLFGDQVDISYDGSYEKGFLDCAINAQGNGFFAHLPVRLTTDKEFGLKDRAVVEWQLTDTRFCALFAILPHHPQPLYHLTQNATVNLTLDQLQIQDVRQMDLQEVLHRGVARGSLKSSTIHLYSPSTEQSLALDKLAVDFTANPLAEKVQGTFFANFFADSIPQGANSLISLSFAATELINAQGEWNWSNFGFSVKGYMDLAPAKELTLLILPTKVGARQKANAILGNLVNASIQGEFINEKGPITFDVKSSNLKAYLPLYYENGNITLTETIEMEFSLTEEVNFALLRELNPILISHAVSLHPMRLFIEREGFIFPLKNYNIQSVRVEKGVFDLGQIRISKGGHIQTLMEFLKADKPTSDNLMEAWFTPIFFNLHNGVLSYKRFDVLLGSIVHIALWGNIDLANDQVQMTLGIDPKNLRRRFNIGGLSKKEMFQVKMSGPAEKPILDWSAATTRLGLLVARTAGGHIGYILGGIIEQFVEAFGEQPAPPPTTSPFPWESNQAPASSGMPVEHALKPTANTEGLRKIFAFLIP